MAIKDILVYVDASAASDTRLKLALDLARQHDAHLTGLHVKPNPYIPPMDGYAALPPSFIEDLEREADAAAATAKSKFAKAVNGGDVAHEWRLNRGYAADEVRRQSHYADLVIVGQRNPDAGSDGDLPDGMLLTTGRPVLVVPYAGPIKSFAKRVMIAWDSGAPATRAVHDAIPLMKDADEVSIIAVNPEDTGDHGEIPCADIALHLARHGIKANAQSVVASDIGVADILLARAFDKGCDLFVMGAYGHSRWRELVLGGVTAHMLDNMTMPVLMAH